MDHRKHIKRGNVRVSRKGINLRSEDLKVDNPIVSSELDAEPSEFKREVRNRVLGKLNDKLDKEFLKAVGIEDTDGNR